MACRYPEPGCASRLSAFACLFSFVQFWTESLPRQDMFTCSCSQSPRGELGGLQCVKSNTERAAIRAHWAVYLACPGPDTFLMSHLPRTWTSEPQKSTVSQKDVLASNMYTCKTAIQCFQTTGTLQNQQQVQSEEGISSHIPRVLLLQRGPLLRQGAGTTGPE